MEDAAIPQVFLVFRVLRFVLKLKCCNNHIQEIMLLQSVVMLDRAVPLLSSWALPGGAVGQEIFMMIAYCLGICEQMN